MEANIRKLKEYFWIKVVPFYLFIRIRNEILWHPNDHKKIRKIIFSPSHLPFYDLWDFNMDDEKAYFIKNHLATDRGMSQIFKERFPETDVEPGCQYDGHWLKRYAADYLNDQSIWE